MIVLWGGLHMKITKVEIIRLHNEYDYVIKFDEQLTFLYGANGCGKTTVLNILTAIVTGKLYNLLEYSFSKIVLYYSEAKKSLENESITIQKKNNTDQNMEVIFKGEKFVITDINSLKDIMYRKSEEDNVDRIFKNNYPVAEKIRRTFNYVYLPLNRNGMDVCDEREYYMRRRRYISMQDNPYTAYLNDSLTYVEELIREYSSKVSIIENGINDKFRKEVLTSSIQVSSDMRLGQVLNEIGECDWNEVQKSKTAYVKTLHEIGVWDESVERQLEHFFVEFKSDYDDYQKEKGKKDGSIKLDLAWKYSEFLKIRSIAELAKENERQKEIVRKPREVFLEVINDFFDNSETDKKIRIRNDGKVYFDTHSKKLNLTDLSSGEKQIIIIFASLIFGLENNKSGIYIVDEPEASLHLAWQAKFVPSILKINKDIQLIFATHSPELIGNYRKKAVKLVRE